MTVSNSKLNFIKDDRTIAALGTGVVAGTAWGVAGYNSKPWVANGNLSDSFVKQIEKKIEKSRSPQELKSAQCITTYLQDLTLSSDNFDLANASIKYFSEIAENKTLKALKQICSEDLDEWQNPETWILTNEEGLSIGEHDYFLDVRNSIRDAQSAEELVDIYEDVYKNIGEFSGSDFAGVKEWILEDSRINAIEKDAFPSKVIAEQNLGAVFNPKTMKLEKSERVSDDIFNIIKSTAKSLQQNAALKCGLIGGTLMGVAFYLISLAFSKPNTKKSNNSK